MWLRSDLHPEKLAQGPLIHTIANAALQGVELWYVVADHLWALIWQGNNYYCPFGQGRDGQNCAAILVQAVRYDHTVVMYFECGSRRTIA